MENNRSGHFKAGDCLRLTYSGVSYWYEIHGDGEAVVLLHGFTSSSRTWSDFIANYQAAFKIIVIDLPGHGKTSSAEVSMEQCCQAIRAILQEIGINSFHLLGYSMGGRTALSYAMCYPEQLLSLTLESASPGLETVEERESRIRNDERLAKKLEQEGIESFVDFWEAIPLFNSQKKLAQHVQNTIREERLSQTAEGLALSLRAMGTGRQPSWWLKLITFEKPVLLVVGELDEKFVTINKRMHELLPNSNLTIIKNAGHAIHVEQPDFFGKIVEKFILAEGKG